MPSDQLLMTKGPGPKNDTFESVILESVRLDRHPHIYMSTNLRKSSGTLFEDLM